MDGGSDGAGDAVSGYGERHGGKACLKPSCALAAYADADKMA